MEIQSFLNGFCSGCKTKKYCKISVRGTFTGTLRGTFSCKKRPVQTPLITKNNMKMYDFWRFDPL